jgi:hypothetical protein
MTFMGAPGAYRFTVHCFWFRGGKVEEPETVLPLPPLTLFGFRFFRVFSDEILTSGGFFG